MATNPLLDPNFGLDLLPESARNPNPLLDPDFGSNLLPPTSQSLAARAQKAGIKLDTSAPVGDEGFFGGLADIGRGLAMGTISTAPQQIGKAAQWFGAEDAGRALEQFGKEQAESHPYLKQSQVGQVAQAESDSGLSLRGGAYGGGENAPLSYGPVAAGALAGAGIGSVGGPIGLLGGAAIGGLAALPIFYGSQAKETADKVEEAQIKAGVDPLVARANARTAGRLSGAIEAGGEEVGNLAALVPWGGLAAKAAVKAGTKGIIDRVLATGWKPIAKGIVGTEVAENLTEMGQQAGEAAVEGAYGAGPGATWKDTLSVVVPTTIMSLIPGVGGAALHNMKTGKVRDALTDAETPLLDRVSAATETFNRLKAVDPKAAEDFDRYAGTMIATGRPIDIQNDQAFLNFGKTQRQELTGEQQADGTLRPVAQQEPPPAALGEPELDPTAGPLQRIGAAAQRAGATPGSLAARAMPLTDAERIASMGEEESALLAAQQYRIEEGQRLWDERMDSLRQAIAYDNAVNGPSRSQGVADNDPAAAAAAEKARAEIDRMIEGGEDAVSQQSAAGVGPLTRGIESVGRQEEGGGVGRSNQLQQATAAVAPEATGAGESRGVGDQAQAVGTQVSAPAVEGELIRDRTQEAKALIQAQESNEQRPWTRVQDAFDFLIDSRGYGDDYASEAAREIYDQRGGEAFGRTKDVSGFVAEVLDRADRMRAEDNAEPAAEPQATQTPAAPVARAGEAVAQVTEPAAEQVPGLVTRQQQEAQRVEPVAPVPGGMSSDQAVGAIYGAINNPYDSSGRRFVPADPKRVEQAVNEARQAGVTVTERPQDNASYARVWDITTPDGKRYQAFLEPNGRGTWRDYGKAEPSAQQESAEPAVNQPTTTPVATPAVQPDGTAVATEQPELTLRNRATDRVQRMASAHDRKLGTAVATGIDQGRIRVGHDLDDALAQYAEDTGTTVDEVKQSDAFRSLTPDSKVNGWFQGSNGKMYLVGSSLKPKDIVAVLYHEATHGRDNPRLNQLAMSAINDRATHKNPQARAFLDRVAQRMEVAQQTGNAGEAMTYLVETAAQDVAGGERWHGMSAVDGRILMAIDRVSPELGKLVRQVVANVRAWAIKQGYNINPTVDDFLSIARGNVIDFGMKGATGRTTGQSVGQSDLAKFMAGSKVVDKDGKPLVVYHGTTKDFTTFRSRTAQGFGPGIYLTDNRQQAAEDFGGKEGKVMDAYVSIKNPSDGSMPQNIESTKAWKDISDKWQYVEDAWQEDPAFVGKALRELGYDGIISEGSNNIRGREIVAFRPDQIKSATGNVGAYGQRPVTEAEAKPLGMTAEQANAAQKDGDIRFSLAQDKRDAQAYERENGILPYTSDPDIAIPLDAPQFSIKAPYTEKQIAKGKLGNHPIFDLPLNQNGTVSLYFPTTNEMARRIAQEKMLRPEPGSNRIYLTNESSGATVMNAAGDIKQTMDGANVLVNIDPGILHVLQEHPDGRKDFFIAVGEGKAFDRKMVRMTRLFTLNKSRKDAISKATTIADITRDFSSGLSNYLALSPAEQRIARKRAKAVLMAEHNVGTLLTANAKLEKTNAEGYGLSYDGLSVDSMGLGLASAQRINERNLNTCPMRAICEGLCLGETSGQNLLYGGDGQYRSGPRLAQYLKTEALVMHPAEFAIMLHGEIESLKAWDAVKNRPAKKDKSGKVVEEYSPGGYRSAVRLNVTSDFPATVFKQLIDAHPTVMFYDYTKLDQKPIAKNHYFTYSSTGASQVVNGQRIDNPHSNWTRMVRLLNAGKNVAMAFTDRDQMPKFVRDAASGRTFNVLDGDTYDARFLDVQTDLYKSSKDENGNQLGVIVGLTNKDRTTPPEQAAQKHNGFFIHYDPKVDGDTVTIMDQSKKTIPIKQEGPQFSVARGQTDTPAFRKWFGDSQVVDDQGRPLILYHGTNKDISVFKGRGTDAPMWFAEDPKLAEMFVGGGRRSMGAGGKKGSAIYPVYLSARKLLDLGESSPQDSINVVDILQAAGLRHDEQALREIAQANLDSGHSFVASSYDDPAGFLADEYRRKGYRASNTLDDRGLINILRDAGFDGIKMMEEGGATYAVFDPAQIKSATGNRGTFDPQNPDIRFSVARENSAPWYSELSRRIDAAPIKSAPAQSWLQYIKGLGGVKPDEIEWSGVREWLATREGKVSKQEVQDYLRQNGVQVQETMLGEAQPPAGFILAPRAEGGIKLTSPDGVTSWHHTKVDAAIGLQEKLEALANKARSKGNEAKANELFFQAALLDRFIEEADGAGNSAQFEKYQLPGGQNYRELLLTLPKSADARQAKLDSINAEYNRILNGRAIAELSSAEKARLDKVIAEHDRVADQRGDDFHSGHFDQPNILAHVRFNDRTDADGNRVLFVEEVQSDWGQKGKKEGFVRDGFVREPGKIQQAPFVTKTEAWTGLALKRVLKYAVDNGYDAVAWTNGEQQSERYDLSKQIREISARKLANGFELNAQTLGREFFLIGNKTAEELPEAVGKDLADKIVRDTADIPVGYVKTYRGLDLKVGGEGMRAYYDRIVPNVANDILKKLGGGRVGTLTINQTEGFAGNKRKAAAKAIVSEQPGIILTDAMREKAAGGMPMFSVTRQTPVGLENLTPEQTAAAAKYGVNLTPKTISQRAKDSTGSLFDTARYYYQDRFYSAPRIQQRLAPGGVPENQDLALALELYPKLASGKQEDFHKDVVEPFLKQIHKDGLDIKQVEDFANALDAPDRNRVMKERNPTESELDALKAKKTAERDALAQEQEVKDYNAKRREVRQAEADLEDGSGDEATVKALKKELAKLARKQSVKDYEQAKDYLKALGRIKPYDGDNTALSGMSDAESARIIAEAKANGTYAGLKRASQTIDSITSGTLDILVNGGLLTKEEADSWRQMYPHYVPRFREEVEEGTPHPVGQGFNIRGAESKKATGSTKDVAYLLAHVMAARDTAIIRSEKNKAGRALWDLLNAHPDQTIAKLDVAPMVKDIDPKTGMVTERVDPHYKSQDNVLTFKIDGVEHTMEFDKSDLEAMRLVAAMKNLSASDIGEVTQLVGKVTRFMATMNTAASPVFLPRNFIRDLGTAFVNLNDTALKDKKAAVMMNVPRMIRAMWRMTRGDLNSADAKLAREFRDQGGVTGFIQHLNDIADKAKTLESQLADMKPGKWNFTKEIAAKYWGLIQDANTAVENGIRLAAYEQARKLGLSPARSLQISNNLTVNFNTRGTKGAEFNSWYMFSNAQIQGTARMIKAMGNRNVQKVLAGVVVSAFLLDMLNRGLAGDDDDDGENDYDQLPDHTKANNFVFWVGGRAVTIPMPYGYNFFAGVGRKTSEALFRKNYSPIKAGVDLAGTFVDAFSPVGQASSLTSAVFPTIAKPVVEWKENKNFAGRPLRKEQSPFGPPKPEYQMGLKSTSAPSKYLAEMLNAISGGNQVRPGLIDVNPALFDYAVGTIFGGAGRAYLQAGSVPVKLATGEEVEAREVPFANIFVGAKPEHQTQGKYMENLRAVETTQNELKNYASDPEMVRAIREDHAGEIRLFGLLKVQRTMMENINRQERLLERNKPDGWKEQMKALDDRKTAMMAQFNKRYVEATSR